MQIYVCVKHVPDSAANIAIVDNRTIDENVAFLLNPYDEHAVTQAAQIKSQYPGTEVIALCLGRAHGEKTLRSALAMGADRGILVHTDRVCDAVTTARVLKAAIVSDGTPDLVFMGRESIDAEGMQTMFRLGVLLNLPAATNVTAMEMAADTVRVTCDFSGGLQQTCEMSRPCIIAAGRGLNTPAYPTFPQVVKARKKPIRTLALADLSLEPSNGAGVETIGLSPLTSDRSPKPLTGSPAEIARQMVTILREEAKVL